MVQRIKELEEHLYHILICVGVTKLSRRQCLSVNGEFSGILEASSMSCGGILTRLTWIVLLRAEAMSYKIEQR